MSYLTITSFSKNSVVKYPGTSAWYQTIHDLTVNKLLCITATDKRQAMKMLLAEDTIGYTERELFKEHNGLFSWAERNFSPFELRTILSLRRYMRACVFQHANVPEYRVWINHNDGTVMVLTRNLL